MQIDAAHAYLNTLRKPAKRAYAQLYWHCLVERACQRNSQKPEPQPSGLSAMGAQAVRMRLREFAPEAKI